MDFRIVSKRLEMSIAHHRGSTPDASSFFLSLSENPATIRVATLVLTTFPITVIYPFFQKYFVGGIMLGAVKE